MRQLQSANESVVLGVQPAWPNLRVVSVLRSRFGQLNASSILRIVLSTILIWAHLLDSSATWDRIVDGASGSSVVACD